MRNINSHMIFDLSVAKKQSDENPVFMYNTHMLESIQSYEG